MPTSGRSDHTPPSHPYWIKILIIRVFYPVSWPLLRVGMAFAFSYSLVIFFRYQAARHNGKGGAYGHIHRGVKYRPGDYGATRPDPVLFTDRCIKEWTDRKTARDREKDALFGLPPSICLSRKLGVGALEVADLLAAKTGFRVADREILDLMAKQANLRERTVELFDEKYPGKMNDFLAYVFGEKSFTESDYTKHLFKAVLSMAGLGSTIFVGRGTHLILPRDRVLAVRFICSDQTRIKRLARVLKIGEEEVAKALPKWMANRGISLGGFSLNRAPPRMSSTS